MTEGNGNIETIRPVEQNGFARRWTIRIAIVLAAFLLGFVPMWLSSRTLTADLEKTKRELRRSQIQSSLSSAVIDARRGEYETSRQEVSRFFTDVRSELDASNTDILSIQEKARITGLLAGRDDIITLLSRNDPAASDRLSNFYVEYRKATSSDE